MNGNYGGPPYRPGSAPQPQQGYPQPQPQQGYPQPQPQQGYPQPRPGDMQAHYPQPQPYGQPSYPQASYPQQGIGQSPYPQPPYGAPSYPQSPYAPGPPQGFAPTPFLAQATFRPVGVFESIPCPYCGSATHNYSAGTMAARYAGGIVGVLIVSAIAPKYTCNAHGEIPHEAFPLQHQESIGYRRALKIGGALALLCIAIGLCILRALLDAF